MLDKLSMNTGFLYAGKMLKYVILFTLYVVAVFSEDSYLFLKGHLGKEELSPAIKKVEAWHNNPPNKIGIILHSSSGEFSSVFELAEKISSLKGKGTKVFAYIDEQALGPAAVFPFLADEISGSEFFAWGDIPSGAEVKLPVNFLQNRVLSLMDFNSKKISLFQLLAKAMTDPNVSVIDDHGWKIVRDQKTISDNQISVQGETLVVNQNQLQNLGLLKEIITLAAFENEFGKKEVKQKVTPEIPVAKVDDLLKQSIKYDPNGTNKIGIIKIDDRSSSISQATWIYVKNALDYYKKIKPIFIILELNTPGGEVFAAQKISDALKELDTQNNIPVVTFINNWAISAGAMIAYSTRFISTVKDGSMGAAEPVLQDPSSGELKTASEKVNSALRTDFANRAKFFDRNPYVAEAMVDKDLILVLRHGKIIKLESEDQIQRTGLDPDKVISAKGKLLTLNADEMIAYGVADILLAPSKVEQITKQEEEQGEWSAKKEKLFSYPFFSAIPNAVIHEYEMDWKTSFFAFLANPYISSALFLGMMLGFYIEMNTPGFGIPGGLALACLALLVLSSFSLEIADWLELILLVSGLVILLVDLFLLPTFGILGFIGVALFLIGFFGMMLPGIGSIDFEFDTRTFNAAGEAFLIKLAWLAGTFIVGIICIAFLTRYIAPSFSGFKRFVLEGGEQVGYKATPNANEMPTVGAVGEAVTSLRPSGKVVIDGKLYEAISSGRFIEQGQKIVVVRFQESTVLVREQMS